jgi:AraC family transcriptional activator of pobA
MARVIMILMKEACYLPHPTRLLATMGNNDGEICSQYTLLIHPDFFVELSFGKKNKAIWLLFLCHQMKHCICRKRRKETIISIFKIIEEELNNRLDDFSQDVIISQIELLLNYANRFYKRQFITRKAVSNDLLQRLEEILDEYFNRRQIFKPRHTNSSIPFGKAEYITQLFE